MNLFFGKKESNSVVTFYTTSDAMTFATKAKVIGIPGRLATTPRKLSAGCGISWIAPRDKHDTLEQFIKDYDLRYERLALT